jgi:hypothetical protein
MTANEILIAIQIIFTIAVAILCIGSAITSDKADGKDFW